MKPLKIRIEKYLKEYTGKRVHPVAVAKKFNLFTHRAIVRLRRAGGCQLVILDIIVLGGDDPVSTYIGVGHAGQGHYLPISFIGVLQTFIFAFYWQIICQGYIWIPPRRKRTILHRARAAKIYQHMNV